MGSREPNGYQGLVLEFEHLILGYTTWILWQKIWKANKKTVQKLHAVSDDFIKRLGNSCLLHIAWHCIKAAPGCVQFLLIDLHEVSIIECCPSEPSSRDVLFNEVAIDLEIQEFSCYIHRLFLRRAEVLHNQNTCTAAHAAFHGGHFCSESSGKSL